MSLRLRGGESTIVVSIYEYLVFLASIWFNSFRVWCTMYVFMLTELTEVRNRLKQGPSQRPQRVETSDTSGEETDASKGCREILSKEIFRMKKVCGATEFDRFFVTRPSDAAKMPSQFYCRVC